MDFVPTRNQLIHIASHFAHEPGTVLLLSGGDYLASRRSILGLFPKKSVAALQSDADPWNKLKEETKDGRWFGYLTYEMGWWSQPKKNICRHRLEKPLASFVQCGFIWIIDHLSNTAEVIQNDLSPLETEIAKGVLNGDYCRPSGIEEEYKILLTKEIVSFDDYSRSIQQILEFIRSGDVYQINLSHPLYFQGPKNPFNLFRKLSLKNPQPFSAYLKTEDRVTMSLSPERFLRLSEGCLESWPIKGTIARGRNREEDEKNLQFLISSDKEAAELMMITDLMRNDLGKVCLPGTIEVPHLKAYEKYETLYHLYSVIRGKLKSELTGWDALKACFPAGSITGCPKMRAMEIIDLLENRPREVYTGSIGYIDNNDHFDFNVAIRTVELDNEVYKLQLGGGITIDSIPSQEFEETLCKGEFILQRRGN